MKINIKNIKIKSICATLFISLFLSCNNGIEELEKKNQFLSSLANLGNDFLSVFTSFGDSFGGVLAFDKTTTKSKVGEYFKKIQETVQGVKTGLNKIVTDMKNQNNPNAEATGTAVTTLNLQLSKIIEGAKTVSDAIGDTDNGLIVDFGGGGDGVGVAGDSKVVQSITEGIK
ncbi:Variable outer membrane protein, partial (plasmid) [Borrelia coriaceae ATCC 43381]